MLLTTSVLIADEPAEEAPGMPGGGMPPGMGGMPGMM